MLITGDLADLTNAIQANDKVAVEINPIQAKSLNNVTSESSDRNQCQDKYPSRCPGLKRHCTNPKSISIMQKICKKTCGYCHTCAKIPWWMNNARIINGQFAPTPIPWQVLIHASFNSIGKSFTCGGTILDEETILSAAHCFYKIESGKIIKWSFFSQAGLEGSGKNPKSGFFLLGLKYTSRTCFEPKNFLSNSCPELNNQVLSFS